MKKNKFSKIKKEISVLEIFVLVVGIIAIGWALGSEGWKSLISCDSNLIKQIAVGVVSGI